MSLKSKAPNKFPLTKDIVKAKLAISIYASMV